MREESLQLMIHPHFDHRVVVVWPSGKQTNSYLNSFPRYIKTALRQRASIKVCWFPDEATWGDIID